MADEVRMIDGNALKAKFCNHCDERDCKPDATDTVYGCVIADTIDNMPTIEAEPVKQDTELSIILQDYGIKDTDTLRYILDQYQKIIIEITGGQMSYLTYPAQAVLDCTNDYYLSALADFKKEIMSREESDELLYGGYEENRKTMIGSNE